MSRLLPAAACLAVFLAADPARAAGPPEGRWKFRIHEDGQTITFLFAFTEDDGKWVGDFLDSTAQLKEEPKFTSVRVADGNLKFTLAFAGREFLSFDGVVARDGKKITGSVAQFGGPLRVVDLRPSDLKRLDDPIALAREDLAQLEAGQELFDTGFAVLAHAAARKLPAEEVRGTADRLAKAAAAYGPRWERAVALRLADTLAGQEGFADVALAQARRAERMLDDDSPPAAQMEVLDTLTRVLTAAGKPDEAKKYAAQVQKLEARDHAEFVKTDLGFAAEEVKEGRKGKGDRVALFEIFTGTDCAPCAAADLAAQGLLRTYRPTEVIVLSYHLPIFGPDLLMSRDGLERFESYGLRAAPAVRVNGRPGPPIAGPIGSAAERFKELRKLAEEQHDAAATVKLALAVTPGEKGYAAKATVSGLEAPGERVVLRFVLVEDRIRHTGQSGVRYHANVVRAFPGGVKGFPLTKKDHEETVTIDPAQVREGLVKFLDDFTEGEGGPPGADRATALRGLKLVALVQNDATGEILQAVQADLK
jgi:hypothetical protein